MRVVMRDELGYIKADTPCPNDGNFLAHLSAIAEDVNVAKHLLVLDPRDRWGSWNNAGGQYNDVIPGFSLGMRNEFSLGWRVGRRQWSEQRWPTCV